MISWSAEAGLWSLFIASFLSATVVPGSSEVVLVALLTAHPTLLWPAIAVATLGNTLGGATSYAVGRLIPNRVEPGALGPLRRHGYWVLLFSWVPVLGDALCLGAGWLRLGFWRSIALIGVGKLVRYALLAGLWSGIGPWVLRWFAQ